MQEAVIVHTLLTVGQSGFDSRAVGLRQSGSRASTIGQSGFDSRAPAGLAGGLDSRDNADSSER